MLLFAGHHCHLGEGLYYEVNCAIVATPLQYGALPITTVQCPFDTLEVAGHFKVLASSAWQPHRAFQDTLRRSLPKREGTALLKSRGGWRQYVLVPTFSNRAPKNSCSCYAAPPVHKQPRSGGGQSPLQAHRGSAEELRICWEILESDECVLELLYQIIRECLRAR